MANILLVMGHRNNDGGDAGEAARTPRIVEAAERVLRGGGHTVHVLQRQDNDGDPTHTHDSLFGVGQRCASMIAQLGIQVMIDAHFQGGTANPTSGCFCIFPDGDGLARNIDYTGSDSRDANPLDVAFAATLAADVSNATGIRRLSLDHPGGFGIMSERQTGVGAGGSRLGMFDLTVGIREQCVRVIMEHGDISADRGVIDAPGFYDRVAGAYLSTVNAFFADEPTFFRFRRREHFRAIDGAVGRRFASRGAEIVRQYEANEEIGCDGFYISESVDGENRWLRTAGPQKLRIHRSGVVEEPPGAADPIPVPPAGPPPDGDIPIGDDPPPPPPLVLDTVDDRVLERAGDLELLPADAEPVADPTVYGCSDIGVAAP